MRRVVDSWGGVADVQHRIVLIRGQDEKIPITAAVVGTDIGLRSFSFCLCVHDFLLVFRIDFSNYCCDFEIWVVRWIFL